MERSIPWISSRRANVGRGKARNMVSDRRADEPETEFFRGNCFYGHARILKKYAGLPVRLPFPATVQHGWYARPKLKGTEFDVLSSLKPHWVWSERAASMYLERGIDEVVVGGAPFVYLADDLLNEMPEHSAGTIVFPFHSTQRANVVGNYENYATQLESLPDHFKPIVVCLYYRDLERGLDGPFRAHGFDVTTNGGLMDPLFLERFISNCAGMRFATSNSLGTSSLYAMYLGLQFFLYGPKIDINNRGDSLYPPGIVELKSWFPEIEDRLHIDNLEDKRFQESVSRSELGAAVKLGKGRLRGILLRLMLRKKFVWSYGTQVLNDLKEKFSAVVF